MRGLIAGLIAGVATDAVDLLGYWLKLDESRYLDFAAVIAFGQQASNWLEATVALIIELGFKAGLGILFVFLIPIIKSKYLLIKTVFLGIMTWFAIYSIILLSKVKEFPHLDFNSALLHIISSGTYGLVLGLTLNWLENKYRSKVS